MKRCLETAETLFPEHDYPQVPRVRVEDLSECDFGKFEYKNYLELSGDMEYQHFIDTMGAEGFPGGESTETFKARTVKAFREILARFFRDRGSGQNTRLRRPRGNDHGRHGGACKRTEELL